MNELTETQKAYLAGFFDGEGCVSITKFQGKNNRTPVYQLQVVVAQKDDSLFDLRELAGVGIVHQHDKLHYAGYQWRMSPKEGAEFLASILPYLRYKKQQAEIAIEFQSKQGHKNGATTGRGWVVPQEMIDEKDRYYHALRTAKGRSPDDKRTGKPRRT